LQDLGEQLAKLGREFGTQQVIVQKLIKNDPSLKGWENDPLCRLEMVIRVRDS